MLMILCMISASDAKHQKEMWVNFETKSTPTRATATKAETEDGPQCRRGHFLRERRGAIPPIGWRPRIQSQQSPPSLASSALGAPAVAVTSGANSTARLEAKRNKSDEQGQFMPPDRRWTCGKCIA